MIDKLFVGLINMSITASLIILVVLLVRLALRKAPKIFSYVLWFAVLFRLICPFSFSSAFSLIGVLQDGMQTQGISWQADESFIYESESGKIVINKEENAEVNNTDILGTDEGKPAQSGLVESTLNNANHEMNGGLNVSEGSNVVSEDKVSLKKFIFAGEIVWLVGAAGLTIYTVLSYIHLRKRVKSAVNIERNIYTSENIDMPFVMGIIKPRIYMPDIKGAEYDYILLHERTHIRRCDDVVKLAAFTALCIHWFNPLVWLAFCLMVKDMEMSCDEAVVRKMGTVIKKDYSMSLLKMASGRNMFNVTPLAFGENSIKSRIKNVLSYKKPAFYIVSLLALACAVLAVLLISNPKNKYSENLPEENQMAEEASSEAEDEVIVTEPETIVLENTIETETESELIENPYEEETKFDWGDRGTDEHVIVKDTHRIFHSTMKDDLYDKSLLYDISKKDNNAELLLDRNYVDYYTILEFSEDCIFKINYELSHIIYEDTDLDTVLGYMKEYRRLPCSVTVKDNKITEVLIPNIIHNVDTYCVAGEVYEPYNYYSVDKIKEENILEQCTLIKTEYADISEREGVETLEIYKGYIGYANMAFLVVRDTEGEIIYVWDIEPAWSVRDGIYLGEKDGESFLMGFSFEQRSWGEWYSYHVFKLDENGRIIKLADSKFSISINDYTLERYPYDEDTLRKWVEERDIYFKNCYSLVVNDREVILEEKAYEADKFSFDYINGSQH